MLKVGDVVAGNFEVRKLIASGGMGTVYEVYDRSMNRQRALKVMHEHLRLDPVRCESFLREAQVRGPVESRHVVEVFAGGMDEGVGPWIVMELLRGETLESRVKRDGPLPRAEVERLFGQLCDAVGKAHAAGVVHLDLKPSNLFLHRASAGEAADLRVFDFGISRQLREGLTSTSLTGAVGTPGWMAPEQYDGDVRPGNDVWSLGLIAFYVLTGQTFWRSSDPMALMRESAALVLPIASQRAAEFGAAERLPGGFDGWFARSVCPDVAGRFRDANEAIPPLLALLEGKSSRIEDTVVAPPPSPPVPTQVSAWRPSAGRVATAAGVVSIALVAARGWGNGCGVDTQRPDGGPLPLPPRHATVIPEDVSEPTIVCSTGMVPIRGGAYEMGDDDLAMGNPRRRVTLSPYCLDETEVTVGAFRVFWSDTTARAGDRSVSEPLIRSLENGRCTWTRAASGGGDGEDLPLTCVDWNTLRAYCAWRRGRLPTEAEWEFAARGADNRWYPWGNDIPTGARLNACGEECREAHPGWRAMVDFGRDAYGESAPVGRFPATRPLEAIAAGYTGEGFRDLAGNVWEWTADTALDVSDGRVSRGGGWDDSAAVWLRTGARSVMAPNHRYDNLGGRCASAPVR